MKTVQEVEKEFAIYKIATHLERNGVDVKLAKILATDIYKMAIGDLQRWILQDFCSLHQGLPTQYMYQGFTYLTNLRRIKMKDYKHLKLQEPELAVGWLYYLLTVVAVCIMCINSINF